MCSRKISFEQGNKLKEKLGIDYFMEVSSKNAKYLFCRAGKTLYDEYKMYSKKKL